MMKEMGATTGFFEGLDREEMLKLVMDGVRYRKLQENLNTEDVEGLVGKISDALGRMNSLVHRIRDLRAPAMAY